MRVEQGKFNMKGHTKLLNKISLANQTSVSLKILILEIIIITVTTTKS